MAEDFGLGLGLLWVIFVGVIIGLTIYAIVREVQKAQPPPPSASATSFSVAKAINSKSVLGFISPMQSVYPNDFVSFLPGSTAVTIHNPAPGSTWTFLQNNSIVACTGSILIGNQDNMCVVLTGNTLGLTACAGASGITSAHWFVVGGFQNQSANSVRIRNCLDNCFIANQYTGLQEGQDRFYVRCLHIPIGQNGNATMDFYLYQSI